MCSATLLFQGLETPDREDAATVDGFLEEQGFEPHHVADLSAGDQYFYEQAA